MNPLTLFSSYITWHYGTALSNIFSLWGTSIWFVLHFFSIPLLLKTLLSPWRRLQEEYKGGLDIENLFSHIIVNILMRLVGLFFRLVIIFIGVLFLIGVLAGGVMFFILWILAPIVIVVLISSGLALLS